VKTSEMEYTQLIKNIREDIYHIDIPIEHPLKNLNIYLFMGEEPALIDAGPYHPLLVEVMEEVLRRLKVNKLSRILITHSHIDHFGLADRLRRLTGAEVLSHHAERPRMERVEEHMREEYDCYTSLAPAMDFPEEFVHMMAALPQIWVTLSEPCPLDGRLRGGEYLKAGDRELEAIHTPGHTAGHLCFYEREEGLLFSGDHLMRTITPNPELYCPPRDGQITGLPQFLDSLRLLKSLPATCAYPGHGRFIKDVQGRVDMNILHHERRLEKTEQAVSEGCQTVWEVSEYLFPQIRGVSPGVDHLLAIKEALGHLVMLEEKGVVKSFIEKKPWRYLPV